MSLLRSFSALTGANFISMGVQLIRGKLAALLLGPAGVGIFNQLTTLWNLFVVVGGLGSFVGVVQHGTEALRDNDEQALRRLSSTSLLLLGVISCTLALVGVLSSARLSNWVLHDGGRHADLVALILLCVPLAVTAQTYHALLASTRAIKALVMTQIATDLGAMIVFVILIFPLGLRGAVAGFMATYVVMFLSKGIAVRHILGRPYVVPRVREFRWATVRANIGFGATGLLMVAMTNLGVLVVSRLIIEKLGIDANGIFSNAWRLASVYLGSVTATAMSYLLPTMGRCESDAELNDTINSALRFYFVILPLPMAGVMAGGELLVWLVLTKEFLPAASLLLLMVPAEFIRVISETVGLSLLVKRRTALLALVTASQFATFVVGAAVLVPLVGLSGAAMAYFASFAVGLFINLTVARAVFRVTIHAPVLRLMLAAGALFGIVAAASLSFPFGPARVLIGMLVASIWLALILLDVRAREVASGFLGRMGLRRP